MMLLIIGIFLAVVMALLCGRLLPSLVTGAGIVLLNCHLQWPSWIVFVVIVTSGVLHQIGKRRE